MKYVIDTNVVISALIKNSLTRKIITNLELEFYTPSFSLSEIIKYQNYICKKASISKKEFNDLLWKLFDYIEIIPLDTYKKYIPKSRKLIKDIKDVPFLACALSLNMPIWSDDKDFKKQEKVKVFTSQEMISMFLKKSFMI